MLLAVDISDIVLLTIIGLALLSSLAMFVCLVAVGLDGWSHERGFWRKGFLLVVAVVMALVFMFFYSRLS